jgi:hypothetical protein
MVIVLWPASGWAQSEIQMVFKPASKENVDARPAPAKVTSKQDSALISEGYFLIGTVSASQPGKKGDAAAMQNLESAILQKAAEAGGDVVCFSKEGSLEEAEVPSGKTRRDCLQSETTWVSSGQKCEKSCFTDSAGHTNCVDVGCSPTMRAVERCVEFSDPIPEMKKVKSLVSEGTVWRHDPELVARRQKEATPGAGSLQEIKAPLETNPDLVNSRTILRNPDPGRYHPISPAEIELQNDWLGAAEFGNSKKVEAMLEQHPDLLEISNQYGDTALYLAAVTGMTKVVEFLLARGANVNASTKDGETPLMVAANYGHPETAEVLIAKGADVNAKAHSGSTPLYFSEHYCHEKKGCKEVRNVLLRHGAHQ